MVWGGRPRPPLLGLQLLGSLVLSILFEYLKSRSKAAGEGARPTLAYTTNHLAYQVSGMFACRIAP